MIIFTFYIKFENKYEILKSTDHTEGTFSPQFWHIDVYYWKNYLIFKNK